MNQLFTEQYNNYYPQLMNLKQVNVLLADDDIDDCNFFTQALKALPLSTHITTVHNGESLMNYLADNSENLPHVLFLDINMPRKSGRSEEHTSELQSRQYLV